MSVMSTDLHAENDSMLQMPERCRQFCEKTGSQLVAKPELRRCFVAHLIMLWERALISPADLDECMQLLKNIGASSDRKESKKADLRSTPQPEQQRAPFPRGLA